MTMFVPVASRVSKPPISRKALMISCASVALAAAAVAPQKARAQAAPGAFNGIMSGNPGTTRTSGIGTDLITVNTGAAGTATINWAPNEAGTGPINFLPGGTTATFTSQNGLDFTVLNRVVPDGSRAIAFNGTVLSELAGGARGGNVWFYSPNGIIVGATAVFDVGGLLLTTNDVTSFSMSGSGFNASFAGGANSISKVQVDPGAQINALQANSYVALVAPRVEQGGTVQVNGAAAYAAGEQLTMTMNQGLFDIQISVGTSDEGNPDDANDPAGVLHTGTTGGPASTGAGDNHRVYMVAVPKNQAITMLLGGNVGFDATTAGEVNGTIVLGSGTNIAETSGTLFVGSPANKNADLTIAAGMYLSDVLGFARGDINATADTGSLAFSGDLLLASLNSGGTGNVNVGANTARSLTVGGDLRLQTNTSANISSVELSAGGGTVLVGGDVNMFAGQTVGGVTGSVAISAGSEGSLNINGATLMSALIPAAGINPDAASSDNYAGNVSITASNDASITFGDNVSLYASANGQNNNGNGDGTAGDGVGGYIEMATDGGWITVNGNLYANADGYGGDMLDGGQAGGAGHGGEIWINSTERDITVNGNMFLTALGIGGSYVGEGTPWSATGGAGYGGYVTLSNNGPGVISVTGNNTMRADGTGGHGQTGGDGYGGSAGAYAYDGAIDLGPNISFSARGTGGNAVIGVGGDGGYGEGGTAFIEALAYPGDIETDPSASTITGGNAMLDVTGTGGNGGAGYNDGIETFISAGAGGDGQGGAYQGERGTGGAFAAAQEPGASLTLANTALFATGIGGVGGTGDDGQSGGAGGTGWGGTVQAGNYDSYATGETTATATYDLLTLEANGHGGFGGAGGTSGVQGNGGVGNGGGAFLNAKGTVNADAVYMNADGFGGDGANGGYAQGGTAVMKSYAGSELDITGIASLSVMATGGTGTAGNGGDAYGGNISEDGDIQAVSAVEGGTITVGGTLLVSAGAHAGNGGEGGSAAGGAAYVEVLDGAITANAVELYSYGDGGDGYTFGGYGSGGDVTLFVDGGTATFGGLSAQANGSGGLGIAGGAGYGGWVSLSADNDGTLGVNGNLSAVASGIGGNLLGTGGAGGGGYGGNVYVTGYDSIINITGNVGMYAEGFGGTIGDGSPADAQQGNAGIGGLAQLASEGPGSITIGGSTAVVANAYGGNGQTAGDAFGGTAAIDAYDGTIDLGASTYVAARGEGGWATVGYGGAGGIGQGGHARIAARANPISETFVFTVGSITGGDATIDASGQGGVGGASNADIAAGAGGDGQGGANCDCNVSGGASLTAQVDGATLDFGNVVIVADGTGGVGGAGASGQDGGIGGNGYGGAVLVGSVDPYGTDAADGSMGFGSIEARTQGVGGVGGASAGGTGGLGGDGSAGSTSMIVSVESSSGLINLRASGFGGNGGQGTGGDGGDGGNALAGTSEITINGAGSLTAGDIGNFARAFAGDGGDSTTGVGGDGGDATGGQSYLTIAEGGVLTANSYFSAGHGLGGYELDENGQLAIDPETGLPISLGANGGIGLGGDGAAGNSQSGTNVGATIDGTATIAGTFIATSYAGGGNGSTGGNATAGDSTITINGSLTAGNVQVSAQAIAGTGNSGDGGSATGGTAALNVYGTLSANNVNVLTRAYGGNGATAGGEGDGGYAYVNVSEGGSVEAVNLTVGASGTGGSGATGGSGYGGDRIGDSLAGAWVFANGLDSLTVTGLLALDSKGIGGNATTGTGGYGVGGEAHLLVQSGASASVANSDVNVDGFGGHSTAGFGGDASAGVTEIEVQGAFTATGETFVSAEGEGGDGSLGGGNAYGGDAQLAALYGGVITLGSSTNVEAEATGGESTNGTGGSGYGGLALVDANQGGSITANDLTASASGEGGSGIDGGSGYGGFPYDGFAGAFVEAIGSGSSITLTGSTTIESRGEGGTATTGLGGSGIGGYVSLYAESGSIGLEDVLIDASGFAPAGGFGGGGNANLELYDGSITGGAVTLIANGTTDGGEIRINVDTSEIGSELELTSLNATANGGDAGGSVLVHVDSGSTADLGDAELSAIGDIGTGFVQVWAEGGDILATDLTLTSSDDVHIILEGGADLIVSGTLEADAGDLVALDENSGGVIQANTLDVEADELVLIADLDVANIIFDIVSDLTLGDLSVSGLLALETEGDLITGNLSAGGDIDLDATGAITTADITAGGEVDFDAFGDIVFGNVTAFELDFDTDGTVTGGNIDAVSHVGGGAEGAVELGNITVTEQPYDEDEDFSVGISSETSISVGDVTAAGNIGFATLGGLTAGDLSGGDLIMLLVGGDIEVGSVTTNPEGRVYMANASMFVDAGGGDGDDDDGEGEGEYGDEDEFDLEMVLGLEPVPTGGSITIDGTVTTGLFQAAAGTDLTTGDIYAYSSMALSAGGNIAVGNATAGESISLDSGGSITAGNLDAPTVALTVAGDFTIEDLFVDDTLLVTAGGNITTGNVFAGGDLSLTAVLDILSLNLTAGGDLTLNAGGSLTAGDLTAGGGVAAGAGTDLAVGNVISGHVFPPVDDYYGDYYFAAAVVASGQNVLLSAGGDLTAGTITSAEGIALDAGGSLTAGNMDAVTDVVATAGDFSLQGVSAGTSIDLTADGLAEFLGLVSAPEITVTSGDITIADGASLGEAGVTEVLNLVAVSDSPVLIGSGEAGGEGQYTLDEDGDIVAETVNVTTEADVIVRNVQIEGSETSDGGVSHVNLTSAGNVVVVGVVDYINAADTDTLAITAGDSIQVVTDAGGGISMSDSDGDLAGTLELTAHDIWVADADLLEQLNANPNFAGRDDALAVNNGEVVPDGYIRAGGAVVTMLGSSFFVQNSGTEDQVAGITVGAGGLTIVNEGSDPAAVTIFGQQFNTDGTVISGDDFFEEVEFAGSGGFGDGSTVNGCEIGGGCSPDAPPFDGGAESILGPIGLMESPSDEATNEDEEEEEEGSESEDGQASVGLINTSPVSLETIIDEPVTSGSDAPGGGGN